MSQNERKEMAGRNRGGRLRPANTPGLGLGGRCSGALPQYVSAITGRAQARNLPTSEANPTLDTLPNPLLPAAILTFQGTQAFDFHH